LRNGNQTIGGFAHCRNHDHNLIACINCPLNAIADCLNAIGIGYGGATIFLNY
jgi:hypothetical protein